MNTWIVALLALAAVPVVAAAPAPYPRPESPTPSPNQRLQQMAGTWDAVVVMSGPDGVEQRTHGTLVTTRLAEFHTVDTFRGQVMGGEFVGQGTNGYCPVRQKYFSFWTDSLSATPMILLGDYDAAQRELVMKGECLGMSGKLEPCRTVTRFEGDDHRTWTLYGAGPGGTEIQHVRIEYSRASKDRAR